MELTLYLKEGEALRSLTVPTYVVKDILRDRLSKSERDRIDRFAKETAHPDVFKAGSVVVDFSTKSACCYQAGLNIEFLEPTWNVEIAQMKATKYIYQKP